MARKRPTPQQIIPEPITRTLALHGPAGVSCGQGPGLVSTKTHLAPFDDLLLLFLSRRSAFVINLDRDPRVELHVQGGDTNYSLRIRGRAVDTGPAGGHDRRLELVHWLPEGATLQRFRAVELIPERIEYAYDEGDERRHYEGRTAAAEIPSSAQRWLRLCFSGMIPWLATAFIGLWAWIGWYGQWYTLRLGALAVAMVGCYGLLASARLIYRVLGHRRWQQGRAARHFGNMLSEGLLPVRQTLTVAGALFLAGLVSIVACGIAWGGELSGVILACTQLWFLVPFWFFRFLGDMDTKTSA